MADLYGARIANITETVIVGTNGIMTGRYIISQLSMNRIPMIIAVGQRGKKNGKTNQC
jgi:hypothetical protein